ncbi:MAG: RHS repeat protein [Desulfobacteraceae bacterium]|nr:MAG: RHS repeat protein [Desulfobacteraceae bacterium]
MKFMNIITLAAITLAPLSVQAGNGLSWQTGFDNAGRITRSIDPAGRATRFSYDQAADGALEKVTRTPPEGPPVVWCYDKSGRITGMTDGDGTSAYIYDNRDRLEKVERKGSPAITYGYDTLDRVTDLRVGDFYHLHTTYDFLGRISSLDTPAGIIRYEYETGQNTVIRTLPNGVKTFWKRQPNGQLEEITHGFSKNPGDTSYSVLAQYKYAHGPDGRIAAISEHSAQGEFTRSYMYDTMGRLTDATGPAGQKYHYEYDQVGNRTKATATGQPDQVSSHDWAGRLTSVDGKACTYDTSGNLSEMRLGGVTRQYRYHPDGRLAEARVGSETIQYRYDGFGRLIYRKAATGETRFIPDPLSPYWQPLVMEEPGGGRTLVIWDGNTPLALVRNGSVEWLLHDHLGSVRLVADEKGKVSRDLDYDSFGTSSIGQGKIPLVPGFVGLFWDTEAGVYHTLARAYRPDSGIFLQPDPLLAIGWDRLSSEGLYTYGRGNPVCFMDRKGEASEWFDNPDHSSSGYLPNPQISVIYNSVVAQLNNTTRLTQVQSGRIAQAKMTADDVLQTITMQQPMQNFMTDEILKSNRKLFAKLLLEVGNLSLNGRPGELWNLSGLIYKNLESAYSATSTMRTVSDYPGDPANDLRLGGLLLKTYGLLGQGSFLASAAGAAATHVPFAELIGSGIRSRVLQNRVERRVSFGGTVLPDNLRIREDLGRYHGSFSIAGEGVSAHGAWALTGSNVGLFGRNRHFVGYSNSEVDGQVSPRGERISGTFHRGEVRDERGGNLFNLFEPTSVTIERYSHDRYQVTRKGGGILSEADAFQPPKFTTLNPKKNEVDQPINSPSLQNLSGGSPTPPSSPSPGGGSLLHPSPIGGIYLGGAGSALDGLGMLKGVQTDANGNLILIGEDNAGISMPPLRLDDVVTVFRSVYLHGEGPTVSIDPNPENPEKSAMIIRHGKATEGTYVGWVLYQSDRLMKCYCLGVDNNTKKSVESHVPGYSDVLDTIYFGGIDPRKEQKEGIWERFWIVPAEANRYNGPRRALTLFEVPLKVKTQKMKWEKDKLVDDAKGQSSSGAKSFTAWFTGNYDGIAAERYLTPPPESGLTGPVPVFSELRRIALLTAVAEKLRDQGIPMPFWMRDYQVHEVPFERFTPGMEATRKPQQGKAIQPAHIFGGVELTPETQSVNTYNTEADANKVLEKKRNMVVQAILLAGGTEADAAKALENKRDEAVQAIRLADSLEGAVGSQIQTVFQEPLTVRQVQDKNRTFQAVPVPGAETLMPGSCRLNEVDMAVPVEGGKEIRLVRSFNSFFNPKGPWGRGWAFDLPRLEEIRIPISRDGNKVTFSIGFELLTPLNSLYARFRDGRPVAELGEAGLRVPDTEGLFYGLTEMRPDFLEKTKTRVLLLKEGRQWHFSQQGDLVAVKDGPQVTVYERGAQGRLTGVVAVWGGQPAGRIALEYNKEGRLSKAVGSLPQSGQSGTLGISYSYDDAGRLTGVTSEEGTVGYRYDGARVAAVTWRGKSGKEKAEVLRSFNYDAAGRLLSEKNGDETFDYSISAKAGGVVTTSRLRRQDGSQTGPMTTRYDQHMRPVEMKGAGGAATRWTYPEAGGVEMTITGQDGKQVAIVESPDGRKRTIRQNGSPQITMDYDAAGRLTGLSEGDQVVLTQEWGKDGQLFRSTTAGQGVTFEYDGQGVPSAVTLHPAKAGKTLSEWRKTKLDRKGRPVEVTDYSGMQILLGYDASGALGAVVQKTPDGNLGYNIKRDNQGRVETVKSSWGEAAYSYDKEGSLKSVQSTSKGHTALMELASGRIKSSTAFDGGRTSFVYKDSGPAKGMPQTITCPNNLELRYGYADSGDLATVKVGQDRLVRLGYDKQGRVTSYAWEPVKP